MTFCAGQASASLGVEPKVNPGEAPTELAREEAGLVGTKPTPAGGVADAQMILPLPSLDEQGLDVFTEVPLILPCEFAETNPGETGDVTVTALHADAELAVAVVEGGESAVDV